MKTQYLPSASRRDFLRIAALGTAVAALPRVSSSLHGEESFLRGSSAMRLGTVTYNLAKDWDIETIIKNCRLAQFAGVELRTTHAHKVEVGLNARERAEVRAKFTDSGVELMGLGSAFDYHTPDQEKLRQDIRATKDYIVLAHDVGAPGVKVRPNALPKEVPVEKTLEQIGRSLRELGTFADGYGIQIRLEVHGSGTSLLPHIKTIMDVADHSAVGVCWNSNDTDLAGDGFQHNFNLVKKKIFTVHMRDLFLEDYPFRKLFANLKAAGFEGYCLAEIPESSDPIRVMKYYRALWLAYQDLI
jgi:sugar phosphate isomerase/epimerase